MKRATPGRVALGSRETAVLESVVYSSLFEYPLDPDQVAYSAPGIRLDASRVIDLYRNSPGLQVALDFRENLFFLRDRPQHVAQRHRRERFSRETLARHQRVLRWIGLLPYTRLIALSGSSAHLNMGEGADIDLFIVTAGKRVWSTAVNILLLSRLLRCRRMLCFNYLVADTHLSLSERDLFSANQLIHLRPLAGQGWMARLRERNPWVQELFPNSLPAMGRLRVLAEERPGGMAKRVTEVFLGAGPAQLYEFICRTSYRRYLKWRAASWTTPQQVRLDAHRIKLHTRSHAAEVMRRYEEELKRVLRQIWDGSPL